MNYNEAIDFIMSHRKFQKTGGHERIEKLLELLGSPHKKLSFVHIVGTNGKGSTSTALSCILKEAGYRTGLFTSPYVVEFGERIQVNGKYIPRDEIAEICELIKEKTKLMENEDMHPTVFEVTTALAMVYFEREKCDIVFLEAGIGGKHDSTNVIPPPLAAVFTAISLDHTEMLGDTTEKIAEEKSGIIKEGTSVVSYPLNGEQLGFASQDKKAAAVIKRVSEKKGCPFITADCTKTQLKEDNINGLLFGYEKLMLRTKMVGSFQVGNLLTAIETVKILREKGFNITDSAIEKGIADFTIPARTEKISNNPLVIIDGGHNEASVAVLKDTVKKYLRDKKVTFLLSFMKDKDYTTCIKSLAPVCETMVFTNVDKVRGESSEILANEAEKYCKNVLFCDDAEKAYKMALDATNKDGALIVAGSFYLAAFVRDIQ
ncbi:MAG: bifunctional folylpolyglutamate synthase/dihydrofolate synthase [Clostridia bacterium]|nr:bifunctional folylpolyglutamate synthase/dihydrofolate synthase [Clostridia bacterium]